MRRMNPVTLAHKIFSQQKKKTIFGRHIDLKEVVVEEGEVQENGS